MTSPTKLERVRTLRDKWSTPDAKNRYALLHGADAARELDAILNSPTPSLGELRDRLAKDHARRYFNRDFSDVDFVEWWKRGPDVPLIASAYKEADRILELCSEALVEGAGSPYGKYVHEVCDCEDCKKYHAALRASPPPAETGLWEALESWCKELELEATGYATGRFIAREVRRRFLTPRPSKGDVT